MTLNQTHLGLQHNTIGGYGGVGVRKAYTVTDTALNPHHGAGPSLDEMGQLFVKKQSSFFSNDLTITPYIFYIIYTFIIINFIIIIIKNNYNFFLNNYNFFLKKLLNNNYSITEILLFTTSILSILLLDFFLSYSSDDLFDIIWLFTQTIIILTFISQILIFNILILYSFSNQIKRISLLFILIDDIINTFLIFLRVYVCFIRFLFYDMQVELVDMYYHYTNYQNNINVVDTLRGNETVAVLLPLTITLDVICYLVSSLISFFKILIASFLLNLILNLFVLKTNSLVEVKKLVN